MFVFLQADAAGAWFVEAAIGIKRAPSNPSKADELSTNRALLSTSLQFLAHSPPPSLSSSLSSSLSLIASITSQSVVIVL